MLQRLLMVKLKDSIFLGSVESNSSSIHVFISDWCSFDEVNQLSGKYLKRKFNKVLSLAAVTLKDPRGLS